MTRERSNVDPEDQGTVDPEGHERTDPDGPVQFAAGGLLCDDRGRFAVVHRPRYDDWSLPKGKREPGERLDETAVREVREETGCTVERGAFAGHYAYDADGPKAVLVWHMTVRERGSFTPDEEVDELAWLPEREARARLTYANERALLDGATERP